MALSSISRTLALLALLSNTIVGQRSFGSAGPFRPGPGITPEQIEVFSDAGRQPNSTSAVTFSRTHNNSVETWSWRINITELAVPDRMADLGDEGADFSEGHRIVNTQWELDWPGDDDTLEAFLESRNMTFRFQALITNKPANVTDSYNDADEGDCTSILGEECVESLIRSAQSDTNIRWAGAIGCENTLNVVNNATERPSTGVGWDIAALDSDASDSSPTYQRGDTFFYSASPTEASDDTSEFVMAESALQVFAMTPSYGSPFLGPLGTSDETTLLCRIVNVNAADEEDDDDDESSAQTRHQLATAAVWGMAILTAMSLV